jgi:hypothetical protein
VVVSLGLVKNLLPGTDKSSNAAVARDLGATLMAYLQETFIADTDADRVTVRLDMDWRRFEKGAEPSKRYSFTVLDRQPLPEDPPAASEE